LGAAVLIVRVATALLMVFAATLLLLHLHGDVGLSSEEMLGW
jgi:hypothetical protein